MEQFDSNKVTFGFWRKIIYCPDLRHGASHSIRQLDQAKF